MTSIPTLGGNESWASAISDNNIIVGKSKALNGESHAFIYFNQEMHDLNDLVIDISEWEYLYAATDINSNGMIVGGGVMNGADRAFLLIPVVNE